jgi:DNA-binding transcriptional regulator YiaG
MANAARTVEQVVDLAATRALARSGEARAIRERAGLSLREMAAALGVTRSALQRWEVGLRTPRGESAVRYGALLAALRESGSE